MEPLQEKTDRGRKRRDNSLTRPIYSDILKELRRDKHLTQEDMARILFVSTVTYSSYENGTHSMPLDVLLTLADVLETSTDYILGRTPVMRPYPPRRSQKKAKRFQKPPR